MKYFLLAFVLAATLAVGQNAQSPTSTAGRYVVSEYANWTLHSLNNVSAASQTVYVDNCYPNLGTNVKGVFVLATNAPLLISDGVNTETVTPTQVNRPTPTKFGDLSTGQYTCSFVATFTKAHLGNVAIGSATYGLEEAINDAHNRSGGIAVIDSSWPGTTSMITVTGLGYPNVSVEDNRAGSTEYVWNGSNYVVAGTGGGGGTSSSGVIVGDTVVCDGTTNATAAMQALIIAAGSSPTRFIFPNTGPCLLQSVTFPSNITLDFSSGGSIKPITSTTPAGGGALDAAGSSTSFNTSSTTCAVTVTPSSAGESYWVFTAFGFGAGATVSKPVSTLSSDVIPLVPNFQSNTNVSMLTDAWLVANAATGPRTFTFTYSLATWVSCGAVAISGLGPTPTLATSASSQDVVSPMTSTAATVQSGSFILGYGGQHNNTETCTAGAGFTQPAGTLGQIGTGGTTCTEYQNSSSAGSLTATQTISSAPTGLAWTYNMVELRPGSATITILGGVFDPDLHQVFFNATGTGLIDFTGGNTLDKINPEWWGASPQATAAVNTPALQAAEHGAFGTNRTNINGLSKYNLPLYLNGNYKINGELQFYHVLNFKIECNGRLGGGITQTASNLRIIDGQSMAYGSIRDCTWAQSGNTNTNALIDLDYDGTHGVDLAPQFIDFYNNTFQGNNLTDVGVLVAKSGGGAQGSDIYCHDCSGSGFTGAAWQAGGNNTGRNVGRFYAQNAIDFGWYGGDIQASPLYGIATYGAGYVFARDMTFENGFAAQTGFDMYCEGVVSAEPCVMENVRSESRRLIAGGNLRVRNSYTVNQAQFPVPGNSMGAGTILKGSDVGWDGAYYKVTVNGTFGGVGTPSAMESATAGGATTITKGAASYTVNGFTNFIVSILQGTGTGETCLVTSNTTTVITCAGGWLTKFNRLTIVNPDATSKYVVEPNWGTQTVSGGATIAALAENGIEGSAGAVASFVDLNHVDVPGDQIKALGNFKNVSVTRPDWLIGVDPVDDTTSFNDFDCVLINQTVSVGSTTKYQTWTFPRNGGGATAYSGECQHNVGSVQTVWSHGGAGGGVAQPDAWMGIDGLRVPTTFFASLPSTAPLNADGSAFYCPDCMQTSPCAGAGSGAMATRINGAWSCSAGGADFASPPALGSMTPNAVHATTLDATSGIASIVDSIHAGRHSFFCNTVQWGPTLNAATIDAPLVAPGSCNTSTNPFVFSNAIQVPTASAASPALSFGGGSGFHQYTGDGSVITDIGAVQIFQIQQGPPNRAVVPAGGAFAFASTVFNSGNTPSTMLCQIVTGVVQIASGTTCGSTGFVKSAMTVTLSADWTCGTGGTVSSCVSATIIGSTATPLTFTLPLVSATWHFDCDLVVGQATAATANQWNLLTASNGVTSTTASYMMGTAATASAYGAVTDQASTTSTFQIAPSWTLGGTGTKMPVHIAGTLTGASASGTVFSLQLVAPTVGDLVTIYEGSGCSLYP